MDEFIQKVKESYPPYKNLEWDSLNEVIFATKPGSGACGKAFFLFLFLFRTRSFCEFQCLSFFETRKSFMITSRDPSKISFPSDFFDRKIDLIGTFGHTGSMCICYRF